MEGFYALKLKKNRTVVSFYTKYGSFYSKSQE